MASTQITVKLRPVRLAIIVPANNRTALLTAISINTVLWGGTFNPIIPLYKQRPAKWHGDRVLRVSARSLLAGFVDGYDPDYIVRTQNELPADLPLGGREVISVADIVKPMKDDALPGYGVGLHEIVRHFHFEELRFVRQRPVDFVAPILDNRYRTFLAAVFGLPPTELDALSANWMEALGARRPKVSLKNYFELLDLDKLFWRRLSTYKVRVLPRQSSDADVLFLMDATEPLDILDYWNLRAAGWAVYPVAKQSVGAAPLRERLRGLVDDAFHPYRYNADIYHHTQIVPSQSTTAREVKDFTTWLDVAPPPAETPAHNHKLVIGYFPRLWDQWARSHGASPGALESDTRTHPVSSTQERVSLPTLPPVFMSRTGFNGTHRYANEITIQHYGPDDLMAEVIPPGPTSLVRAIGGIGFDEWRFAQSGLVFLSRYKDWSISLELPRGERLFPEWLKVHGWTASISPPGRIARQMLKQLGGPWGVECIANRRIIDLLERMSRARPIKQQEFWAEINRVAQEERWIKDPARTLKRLIDAHVFQLGVELQCPTCMQRSWYSMADADYELLCPKCLETFRLPEESPKDIKWAYRSIGPFSLESRSHGVYCVLLTFRFFDRVLDAQHTTMLSFEAKKDGKSLEADLAAFIREKAWWRQGLRVVFAECKTFNRFEARDATRMRDVARAFPGAVLLFATLNETLTNAEKRLIRRLANRGRRHWRDGASLNPVLVLTGKELFAEERPEQLWKNAGGRHAAIAANIGWAPGINELCDATQQLYLDMPPWLQWFEEQMRRQRQRKSKTLSAAAPKLEGQLNPTPPPLMEAPPP